MIRDLTDSLISAFKKEILKENGNDDVGSLQDIPALMSDMFEAAAATTYSALTRCYAPRRLSAHIRLEFMV